MRTRAPSPEPVAAWDLSEGDELPEKVTVVSVSREVKSRTVRIVTDEPQVVEVAHDHQVPVVRQI